MKDPSLFKEESITEGNSGDSVSKFSHNKDSRFSFVVKGFDNVEEGLKELLDSLLSYRLNSCPSTLKMARIIDAIILPGFQDEKPLLKIMIEGMNSHDIHHFLGTNEADFVVQASAAYLAQFHTAHNGTFTNKERGETYFAHKAEMFLKLEDNPLDQEGVQLLHRAGKKEEIEGPINAGNLLKLLCPEQQKKFENAVLWHRHYFKENCQKIYQCLKPDASDQQAYFLTKTHGDAHGHNFFYDDVLNKNVKKESSHRISMIDYSSLCRTYKNVGDPAEDVGRFLGSLWDWACQEGDSSPQKDTIQKVRGLEALFLKMYRFR